MQQLAFHSKRFFLVGICLFLATLKLHAQYDPARMSRKAMSLYTRGIQLAGEGDFRHGIKLLEQAVEIEKGFADALISLGGIYSELKQYEQAIPYYRKAKEIDSFYFRDYALPFSITLAGQGRFEEALAEVEQFLSIPDLNPSSRKAGEYRKSCYAFAVAYAKAYADTPAFDPHNLGDSVNSAVSEYFPTVTIDGKQLVFTRRVDHQNEDFYQSIHGENGWSKSQSLPGEINTPRNEGAQNISQDGQWLIFTGCNFPESYGSCDLYISYLTTSGWSKPENLGPEINTEWWESAPSLSPDKQDLYFASNRPGGLGNSDIYVSHRQPDGTWSTPRNLGPQINTAGNESAPFIHADNRTLYFTSDGHPGYGGDDLYRSRKLPGNKWDTAVNLGFPINTIENEGSLVVASDGQTAYYASDRADSRGGLDIYSFTLREELRPARTLWVTGKVFDAQTRKGLPSSVELTDLSNGELISRVQTDETGNYLVTLPVGSDYAFNVSRPGYLFASEHFQLSTHQPDSTYQIDIPLQPLDSGAYMVLRNIFFDVNEHALQPASGPELDKVIRLLQQNPSIRVLIEGHTDNTGDPQENLLLSRRRAEAVVNYLVGKGIPAERLSYQGRGASQPIADNSTEEGRALNRRTGLKIIR